MPLSIPTLTVGIIAKNEELLLPSCLKSIQSVAHEVIVVDTGSTDRTVSIAQKFGAKTLFYPWDNNFSRARNVYVKAAKTPWILSIDADETIASRDLPKIKNLIKSNSANGFLLKSRVYTSIISTAMNWHPLDGKYPEEEQRSKAHGFLDSRVVRLFRKERKIFYNEKIHIHENISYPIFLSGGKIKNTDVTLHDYGCRKGNAYAWEKQEKYFQINLSEFSSRRFRTHELRNLAIGYLCQEAPDQALIFLRRATRQDKNYIPAYYLSAVAYREKGDTKKAISCLCHVFKLKKNDADALWLMGICLDDSGCADEGLVYVLRALKQTPNHAVYLNSLGVIYYRLNRFEKAKRAFEKSNAMLPSYRQPSRNLSALKYLKKSHGRDDIIGLHLT